MAGNPNPSSDPQFLALTLVFSLLLLLAAAAEAASFPPSPAPSHSPWPSPAPAPTPAPTPARSPSPSPSPSPQPKLHHSPPPHQTSPPVRKSRLNSGEKVGVAFAGIALVMQVAFGGFLIYKKRQLRRMEGGLRGSGASSAAPLT